MVHSKRVYLGTILDLGALGRQLFISGITDPILVLCGFGGREEPTEPMWYFSGGLGIAVFFFFWAHGIYVGTCRDWVTSGSQKPLALLSLYWISLP